MSRVFVTSDWHLGHKAIVKYRPQFSSVDEHDEHVFRNMRETLTKRDVLYVLGDVCFCMSKWGYIVQLQERVKVFNVVLGNHDLERSASPKLRDWLSLPKVRIHAIKNYKGFWLTHAPIHPQELRGKINIHGHVHGKVVDDPRYIDVSLESCNYLPVDISTLKGGKEDG